MTKTVHRVYLSILVAIVFLTFISLLYIGLPYYRMGPGDRVLSPEHELLKPSGHLGHGLGIIGTFLIITGVGAYMARKRYRFLSRIGILKYWLEFHIFLCTLGPVMILFHTSYKFGGLVAISFWSMVAVFLSGIIGRFIYLQIPRTIEGRELSLNEIQSMKTDVVDILKNSYNLDERSFGLLTDALKKRPGVYQKNVLVRYILTFLRNKRIRSNVRSVLKRIDLSKPDRRMIFSLINDNIKLNQKLERLNTMQNLFRYWHVIHLPFALIMLVIMLIHVSVTILFGYRWIF